MRGVRRYAHANRSCFSATAGPKLMREALVILQAAGLLGAKRRRADARGSLHKDGALAQLVERLLCKQDVVGSIPSGSTNLHV